MKHTLVLPIPDDATLLGKILAVFRAYNTRLSAKQVAVILGVRQRTVSAVIVRACKEKLLTKAGKVRQGMSRSSHTFVINVATFDFSL